jgi:hypothetical protein
LILRAGTGPPTGLDHRTLIGYSEHLGAYAVQAQLAWDDVIELTSLTIDVTGPAESLPHEGD